MMRLTYFCYISAALAGLTGMSLGIYMGLADDHSLAPAHAHVNLLGWVTMMLYGLYHRGAPKDLRSLRWMQVGLGGVGFVAMAGGLAVYLGTDDDAAMPAVVLGSLCAIMSMVLFVGVLVRDAWRLRPANRQWHGHAAMSG